MKLGIVTPVGPGHEDAYLACSASIDAAVERGMGAFTSVEKIPVYDLQGALGRSAARNKGVSLASSLNCDWVLFLDADDFLFDEAFAAVSPFLEKNDAVWGMICEARHDGLDHVKIRENQLKRMTSAEEFFKTDPFSTLQIGMFVRTSVAIQVSFDENMDTGEDFKYYIALWMNYRCVKIEKVFVINIRGNESNRRRSAIGQRWGIAVQRELAMARKSLFSANADMSNAMKPINSNTLILELSGKGTFTVFNHWFWSEFMSEWEPQTWDFYRFFTVKGRAVIDIGSWIGPTALIAVINGASNVLMVEANKATLTELQMTKILDPELDHKWELIEGCVSDQDGFIEFGSASGELKSSSASSDRGKGSLVAALRFQKIIEMVENPSVIKIDIEGTEIKILQDIIKLSPSGAAIWLSWHPPLWGNATLTYDALADLLQDHFVLNSQLEPIDVRELWEMISSDEEHPKWGNSYGNLFETAILSKHAFDLNGRRLE